MTSHVVIGGCGFLGRNLVKGLKQDNEEVAVVDMCPFPSGCDFAMETRLFDMIDASDRDFDAMIDGAEVVHHYAWTTLPASANLDPFGDLQDNLRITIRLLEALRRRGTGRMIFASSGGTVYGKLTQVPVPENHPLEPITAYGISKVAAEKYLQLYRHLYGVDTRVARIANPYGTGQNPMRQQGAISTFVHRALRHESIEVWGDGAVVRDYIHVADVVPALQAIARLPFDATQSMPILNIGSGSNHTLSEVLQLIEGILESPLTIERQAQRSFDVPVSVLDISKARRDLNWQPKIDLRTGIALMIEQMLTDPSRKFSNL